MNDSNPYKPPSSRLSLSETGARPAYRWSNWFGRLLMYATGGLCFGLAMRKVRPYFSFNGLHFEAIFSLLLLSLWVVLLSLYYRQRVNRSLLSPLVSIYALECGVIWTSFLLGWTWAAGYELEANTVQVIGGFGLVSSVFGLALIFLRRRT